MDFYTDFPQLPDAACRDIEDPEIFFPHKGAPSHQAKWICQPCPAREACLEWALDTGREVSGIWGGLSEYERRRLIRDRTTPHRPTIAEPRPEPTPAPLVAVAPAPVVVPRAYVEPHHQRPQRRGGLDWDALAPVCRGCGQKSSTVNTQTGMCATCLAPVADPRPKPAARQPQRRGRKRATATPSPRPRRRVIGRDPDAPRRPRQTPGWAKPIDEHAVIAEYQAGDSAPAIAERHGVGAKRVRGILDRHNIPRRDDRTTHSGGRNAKTVDDYDPRLVHDITSRYQAGATAKQLAADHQVSEKLVSNVLAKAGVVRRAPAHVARATILTPDQEAQIARRYANGESSADLAAFFHIRAERARQIAADHAVTIRGRLTPDMFGAARDQEAAS